MELEIVFLIAHIVGAGVLVSIALFSVILSMKETVTKETLRVLEAIRKIGPIAAGWQVVTGLYLYFQEAEEFNESGIFWLKMALFVLDGIVAVLLVDKKIKDTLAEEKGQPAVGRIPLWALVNLVVILTVVSLGVVITEKF